MVIGDAENVGSRNWLDRLNGETHRERERD